MTDILLTHSFFIRFDPKQQKAMMPYPPLGTLYAAGALESAKFSVGLFDTMLAGSEQELEGAIEQFQPKIVAIYDDDFNYLSKMCLTRMRDAAFEMIRIAKRRGLFVIVHGSDSADHFEQYLDHGADVIVSGEGEQTIVQVCEQYLRKESVDFSKIAGVIFRTDGTTQRTAKREVMKNLDILPLPARHLIDLQKYRKVWMSRHGFFSVNVVTTRGCPYHCNWCAKPVYGQVYGARSPDHVVEEIISLMQTVKPDHIWFADDIFGLKPGWVQRFSALIREKGIRIRFTIQSRADLLLQGDTVGSLASAGCDVVWIGAESGSQKILDAMEKGITVGQIYEARRKLKNAGMKTAFFLQFGYRGETMEDIRSTITMVQELLPDDIGISVSYPLPGTTFYDSVKAELQGKQNWTDSDDLAMMSRGTYSPKFYRRLHRYVHKIFRIRRAFLFIREIVLFRRPPTRLTVRKILTLAAYLPGVLFDRVYLSILVRR